MSFNEKLSYTEHVVTAPATDFSIGFKDYGDASDTIKVTVNDVLATDAGYTVFRKNAMTIALEPAVTSGIVRLQRETNIDGSFYQFTAGAKFVAANIDANFEQILHSQQEIRDDFDKLASDVYPLVNGLEEALESAESASKAAQEAAEAAEEAAQVTRSASQVIDASGLTQQAINDHIVNIKEFGGNPIDFDPSVAESAAKAIANPNALPYIGARQTALPMQTLKVWNYLDGYRDRGAVASFRNVNAFDSIEPRTEILGISTAAGLGDYKDRDAAGLFVQVNGQPALHTSTATVFTATTVTCADMPSRVKGFLRKNQIIDVVDGGMTYSGLIQSVLGDTITVDTAWYKTDGSKTAGTPSNGSRIKIVPNTKVWATNFNAMLSEESDATRMVGIELGMFNNKASASGYGYDVWSGGTYTIGNAYQARGKFHTGLSIEGTGVEFGVVVNTVGNIGYYGTNAGIGSLMQNGSVSYVAKNPSTYAFQVQNSNGGFLSGVNKNGQQERLKLSLAVVSPGATISPFIACAMINPASAGTVNLPEISSSNVGHTIYVKNLHSTNAVSLVGPIEGGAGAISLPAKTTIQFISDGVRWFPISKHTF